MALAGMPSNCDNKLCFARIDKEGEGEEEGKGKADELHELLEIEDIRIVSIFYPKKSDEYFPTFSGIMHYWLVVFCVIKLPI